MDRKYWILDIKYDITRNNFKIAGNINKREQHSFIRDFLDDDNVVEKDIYRERRRDMYHFTLKKNISDGKISAINNTEVTGLRNGILLYLLRSLDKK